MQDPVGPGYLYFRANSVMYLRLMSHLLPRRRSRAEADAPAAFGAQDPARAWQSVGRREPSIGPYAHLQYTS